MSLNIAAKIVTLSAALALPAGMLVAPQAYGQSDSGQASGKDPSTLLKDFLHYIRIAKPDLALASGQALLDSGVTNEQLAMIVAEDDLDEKLISVIRRGRRMPGISDVIAEVEQRVEDGRIALARDPERIRKAVAMLDGTMRQKMLAENRLLAAGEYAVPALLEVIVNGKDPQLEVAATQMIEKIKRQAVLPLCAALGSVEANAQRKICNMLGEIGYPAAEPFLLELAQAKGTSDMVKEAAMRAFRRLGGTSTSLSSQFASLGRRFFDGELSLVAWPSEPRNNVWSYDPYGGLTATSVPTEIFGEVMAMMLANKALSFDRGSRQALALWVAADLRRENDLLPGSTDPIFGNAQYSPQFFATLAGTSVAQDVLSMAIDQYDTALVRDAIAALADTTGSTNLFSGSRLPLLECLRYPDRRVQYDSALVMANALPTKSFPGDEIVIPLLGSAVRDSNAMFGIIVASNDEDRRTFASDLQSMGFTVLNGGSSYASVRDELGQAIGLDLVIVRGEIDMIRETIKGLRNDNLTAAVPIVASANLQDQSRLSSEFADDRATVIWTAGAGQSAFTSAVDGLLTRTGGGRMSEDDALAYMMGALDALRSVAANGGTALNASDAEPALLSALSQRDGWVKLVVAEVISMLPGAKAQQALLDTALSASDDDQIELLDYFAASARRFGNQVSPRQIKAMLDLISNSTGDTADAASRAYGALNVGPEESVELILQ